MVRCASTPGGEKVYPEEVEAALKGHPDVFDAVVVGVPDERFQERVAAVVTAARARRSSSTTSRRSAARSSRATRFRAQLHVTDEIPRTPVGKPDYRWAKRIATDAASPTSTETQGDR